MLGLGAGVSTSSPTEAKYSLSLDGTNDYLDTGATFNSVFQGNWSVSLWVNFTDKDPSSNEYVWGSEIGTEDVIRFGQLSNQTYNFYFKSNNDAADSNSWATGYNDGDDGETGWQHFVITAKNRTGSNATQIICYQNGVLKTNVIAGLTGTNHAAFTSTNLFLGARNDDGTAELFSASKISSFAIWNAVLDADAVAAIYNNGIPTNLTFDSGNYDNSSALQGYWRMGNGFFDDKANGIIHDQDNPGFGSNLVVNADFSTNEAADQTYLNGGLQFDNWVEQQSSGLRKFELTSDGQGIKCTIETANDTNWNQRIYQDVSSVLTVGDAYEFSVDILCSLARNFEACIETSGGAGDQFAPDDVALSANTRTVIKKVFRCTATSDSGNPMTFHLYPTGDVLPAGEFYEVRNPSLKKLNGNPGITSGGPTFSSDTP